MNKWLISAFILLASILSYESHSQTIGKRFLTGRVFHTQVGSTGTTFDVNCNFYDDGGLFDGTDVQVGDMLFVSDGGKGYYMPITSILTPGSITIVIRVNKTNLGLSAISNGVGYISRGSSYLKTLPFASGIS